MKKIAQVFFFDVFAKGATSFISILLIRYMTEGEYARYILTLSVVAVVTGTLTSSFNRIYVVGYERLRISSSFLGLQLAAIAILSAGLLALSLVIDGIYWFAVPLIIGICLSEYARTAYQQEMRFFRYSLVETLRALLFTGSLLILLVVQYRHPPAALVILLQAGTFFAAFVVMYTRVIDWSELLHLREAARLGRAIVAGKYRYLFGYFFVLAVFAQVDIFMLKSISSERELATYGSAFRYYTIVVLGLNSVHTVLLPTIQRANSVADLSDIYRRYNRLLVVLLPLLLIGAWLAGWIIPAVDEGKYPAAVACFRVLTLSAAVSLICSPYSNVVLRFEDFKFLFLLIGAGLLLVLTLNLVLVPAGGSVGAAWATLIAYGVVNLTIFGRARRYHIYRRAIENGLVK